MGAKERPVFFLIVDWIFTVAFAIELMMRIKHEGISFFSCYNKDIRWNVFDFVVVAVGLAEEVVALVGVSNVNFSASIFRLLRLLRLTRVLRILRVLRFFQQLRILVLSILSSVRLFSWALMLLFLISYSFALFVMQIVVVDLNDGVSNGKDYSYWKSVVSSVYTLFLCISGGVDWKYVLDPLIDLSPIIGPVFCIYIAFSVFCVLNIVTGVFVENAVTMTAADEEHMLLHEMSVRKKWIEEVKRMFHEADEFQTGEISFQIFRRQLRNCRIQYLFKRLGVDVLATDPKSLFELFDLDNSGSIELNEMAIGLQRLAGNASGVDLAAMRNDMSKAQEVTIRLEEAILTMIQKVDEHVLRAAPLRQKTPVACGSISPAPPKPAIRLQEETELLPATAQFSL